VSTNSRALSITPARSAASELPCSAEISPHIFSYLHGTEVCSLSAFLRQDFVVEFACRLKTECSPAPFHALFGSGRLAITLDIALSFGWC
jgi:hypothetical protein